MLLCFMALVAPAGQLDLAMSADDFVLTAQTERGVRRLTTRMFTTYDDVLGLSFPERTQMTVRLIEARSVYDAEARAIGLTAPTLGFFSARTGEGVVWRNRSEAAMRSTLVHEASHFLMVRGGAAFAPTWLHEGMATMFGHARLTGNAVFLDPPTGIGAALQRLDDQIPPAETLLADPSTFAKIPPTRVVGPADYAVGWALCAFLMSSTRGKAVLAELLRTPPGSGMVAVIARRWSGGTRAFDQQWRAWWGRAKPIQLPIRASAPATQDDGSFVRCNNGMLILKGSGLSCPEP